MQFPGAEFAGRQKRTFLLTLR